MRSPKGLAMRGGREAVPPHPLESPRWRNGREVGSQGERVWAGRRGPAPVPIAHLDPAM